MIGTLSIILARKSSRENIKKNLTKKITNYIISIIKIFEIEKANKLSLRRKR